LTESGFPVSVALLIIVVSKILLVDLVRLVRGETLSLCASTFRPTGPGQAAHQDWAPAHPSRIPLAELPSRHLRAAGTILILATLSLLGFCLPLRTTRYNGYWWKMYPAGVIIAITVIAFSSVGDALLDALEVRVRRGYNA
jgi:peptide/nickel transport system permease protein